MTKSASTDRAKRAAIYREAARLLEVGEEDYACNAIWTAAHPRKEWRFPDERDQHPRVVQFTTYFKPKSPYGIVFGSWFGHDTERGRSARITALCFMAAMVEAGDA